MSPFLKDNKLLRKRYWPPALKNKHQRSGRFRASRLASSKRSLSCRLFR